jgi:hypothetical protein
MKEFKGTQGEWRVIHEINVTSKNYRAICACGTFDSKEKSSQDINQANAKLIAAAPKLLKALQDLVRYCKENQVDAVLELSEQAINEAL